jgi:hypothetical protein
VGEAIMTDEELQAIRARAEAATPGPWTEGAGKVAGGETRELVIGADNRTIIAMAYGGFGHPTPDCTRADRAFIAAARTDVPALLAEVDRLREILTAIIYASDGCVGHKDCNHSIKPWKDARAHLGMLSSTETAGSCRTCGIALPATVSADDPFCSDRCRDRWAATLP